MTFKIHRGGPEWAYPTMEEAWRRHRGDWVAVTNGFYQQALEVLPPMDWRGSRFLVPEPWCFDEAGHDVYAGFVQIGSRTFAKYTTRAGFAQAVAALLAHVRP